MELTPIRKDYRIVYTIVERQNRKFWIRIGAAFENRDGSWNVHLDAVPTNGQLQIREPKPNDDLRARESDRPEALAG